MDAEELHSTARTARLTLKPEEVQTLRLGVERMLAYFSHMKEIDVEGLAPTTHALLRQNRFREDRETAGVSSDALIENAPQRDERFIVVPNLL
jgi:aspartyl-tRNA(Asn)/glutamyl-tRNA(Gln) amidotransferase subunit C